MKCFILFFFVFTVSLSVVAQNIPEVKLENGKSLKLSQLHIKTNITGNIAVTTYHMTFYNNTNRVLEGELAFPLGQGQSVTDFAMDVNGKLRHAVVVEKELGRVAYENTIRQRIDPGLLEMTKGNNYKARVYPIPAKGYKELLITYEEVLTATNKKHNYILPLQFTKSISNFSLDITVYDKSKVRLTDNIYGKFLRISNNNGSKNIIIKERNFIPKEGIKLVMELDNEESISTYNNYFSLYKIFLPKTKLKNKPKTITLFWDASYSMEYRAIDTEIKLLDKYFAFLNNVSVKLVVFNIGVKKEKVFNIKNGKWSKLKNELKNINYDGGTSFKNLSTYKSDEYLFFTDGMHNLGDIDFANAASIYTINAITSANHNHLYEIATKTGANYINLKNQSVGTAFNILTNQVYQFLGVVDNNNVHDIYPKRNTNVNEDFLLSGKFKNNTEIQLLFGYNNLPQDTLRVTINKGVNNNLAKRLWAKEKLKTLSINAEKNKNEIIRLATKNQLITAYTSMIILDRIEDYVRYKIDPPSDLKDRYKELVRNEKEAEEEKLAEIKSRKQELYDDYTDLLDWYNRDFSKSEPIKKTVSNTNSPLETLNNTQVVNQNSGTGNQEENVISNSDSSGLDLSKRIVRGTVMEDGAPLPGVNVYVLNKNNGVATDFDGKYAINVEEGDILVYSYLGYITNEVPLGSNDTVNVELKADQSQLDEVVVIGYGTVRKQSVTASITSVRTDSIEGTLQGSISGVQVESASGQPRSGSNITIRGNNSFNDSFPLYIVDGIPYNASDFETIKPEDIDNISVVKDAAATAIYGSRASNGLIVVVTKKGLEEKEEEIKAINQKVDKAINFKAWSPNADYLVELSKSESVKDAYKKYLKIRHSYINTPTFFIDVAEYFDSINEKKLAIQIVSNLIEIKLDDHELMRALGYKLEYFEENELAVYVYEEVVKLRPEEPHSYRDLALVYSEVGQYQKAFDLLYKIIDGGLLEKDEEERFYGIEHLAYVEACNLVSKYSNKLNLDENQIDLFREFKVDLRVVIDWNHNNTDLDLWVVNPKSEKILYSNKSSKDGGK